MTQNDLVTALRDCFDPNIPCNIVDLGEVVSAELIEDQDAPGAGIDGVPARYRAKIELTLPVKDDAAEAQLQAQIANRLAGLQQISSSEIAITNRPAWTPDRITPQGRRLLRLDSSTPLVQIQF